MRAKINDANEIEITTDTRSDGTEPKVTLRVDLFTIFEALTDDERLRVAEALTWGPVLQQAVARLCGESGNWNSGDDNLLSAEVLMKMSENAVGSEWRFWDQIKKLRNYAKELEHSEALYWRLWHDQRLLPTKHANGEPLRTVAECFRYVLERPEYRTNKDATVSETYNSTPNFNASDRFTAFCDKVYALLDPPNTQARLTAEYKAAQEKAAQLQKEIDSI